MSKKYCYCGALCVGLVTAVRAMDNSSLLKELIATVANTQNMKRDSALFEYDCALVKKLAANLLLAFATQSQDASLVLLAVSNGADKAAVTAWFQAMMPDDFKTPGADFFDDALKLIASHKTYFENITRTVHEPWAQEQCKQLADLHEIARILKS